MPASTADFSRPPPDADVPFLAAIASLLAIGSLRSKIEGDSFRLASGRIESRSAFRGRGPRAFGIALRSNACFSGSRFDRRLLIAVCLLGAAWRGPTRWPTIRARGHLIWGGDAEGGGPYVYPDPASPRKVVGFEVDLAEALAAELGVTAQFFQAPWDDLPSLLETGQIDVILNGYELTPARAARMASTSPYYVYRLDLLVPRAVRRSPIGTPCIIPATAPPLAGWHVGFVGRLSLHAEHFADDVDLIGYRANTDAMREVENDKLDATVVDLPIATFYRDEYPGLRQVGPPIGGGYYVAYVRQQDQSLAPPRHGLGPAVADGRLQEIYERYDLWNDDQEQLAALAGKTPLELGVRATRLSGWQVLVERGPILVRAAGMTVLLACLSMPLAIALGVLIALAGSMARRGSAGC